MTFEPAPSTHAMAGHVIGRLGLHSGAFDARCPPGIHLHVAPQHLDPDGEINLGVLGVFVDMASGEARIGDSYVHADIDLHRLNRAGGTPVGTVVGARARVLRKGRRTGVVEVELFDELARPVARSTQQVVFVSPRLDAPEGTPASWASLLGALDGVCRLDGSLAELVGTAERPSEAGSAELVAPLQVATMNGGGSLFGGVVFTLAADAARTAARSLGGPERTVSAAVRYLAPLNGGPVRAVARVLAEHGEVTFVRVEVFDDGRPGSDARPALGVVADVHLTR